MKRTTRKNIHKILPKSKRSKFKEENAETILPASQSATVQTTPILPTGVTSGNNNDSKDNKDPKSDPIIAYIIQQIEKNKEQQLKDAQTDFAYRQQQANQIVSDIENYLKQNTNKQ